MKAGKVPKIKGTSVLATVKFLRRNREAALAALPVALHHYLNERILVSGWYPEEEVLALWRAMLSLIPMERNDALRYMGRVSAEADLTGIYKHFVRKGTALSSLERMATMWRFYHDTGNFRIEKTGEERARIIVEGFGLPSKEMCEINTGWFTRLAELGGAQDVEINHLRCCCRGDDSCEWELKWRDPEES